MHSLTCKSIRGLKIGTGIQYLVMALHISLLVADLKAFSKFTETTGISSFILSGEWLSESKHTSYIMHMDRMYGK
jgi:hypothetical protein